MSTLQASVQQGPKALSLQEAKSRQMRETIFKATIDCLHELGYAETSINRIVEKAGVTKGALQHHFSSKVDLICSTAEYLLQRSLRFFEGGGHAGAETVAESLLRVWDKFMNTRQYLALLEILVAARTDQALSEKVTPILQQGNAVTDQYVMDFYGSTQGNAQDVELLMLMNRCLMRGLLIQERYSSNPKEIRTVLNRWLEMVTPLLKLKNDS